MSNYLLFFGPPGSGKSTQGLLLSAKRGIPHISIGELLRAEAVSGSARSAVIAGQMGQGGMVADEIVVEMLREHFACSSIADGFILDGFPRAQRQLVLLEQLVLELGLPGYRAVDISLPRDESYRRLMGRGRADDTPEVVERRLDAYAEMSGPVLRYFADREILLVVDGHGSIEEVAANLDQALAA
jgi:adenylate kinase